MSLVTLAEAKRYLGQELQTDDDTLIGELITATDTIIESYTRRVFTLAEQVDLVDGGGSALILLTPPLGLIGEETTEVTLIEDVQNDDEEYDLDDIDVDTEAGLVYLLSRSDWSAGRRRWRVTYGGGFDGAPADVKTAALIIIADRYEHRDAQSGSLGDASYTTDPEGIPTAARKILDSYRLRTF